MPNLYRVASGVLAPLVPLWLELRRLRGKEDASRGHERLGYPSAKRPLGTLLWIHAASVGEANSVLLLIDLVLKHCPSLRILLTSGTVTSARLMAARLPSSVIHQYVPVDTPEATDRFMRHWRPDIALWVESEFWPNLIEAADRWQCFMGVINGRISERSFRMWNRRPTMIRSMLKRFDIVYAQTEEDGKRLAALGARNVSCLGNLKYDAKPLACDEGKLVALQQQTKGRPLFLAASTHPGEEKLLLRTHELLKATLANLLTVIVPRHPARGRQLASELSEGHRVTLRSENTSIKAESDLYIADTLGELGLFYRLCDVVFMGGSLVKHGGQNPLEPARLSAAILTGPFTHNFTEVYNNLEAAAGCVRVRNAEDLAAQLSTLLSHHDKKTALQKNAHHWVENQSGTAKKLLAALWPALVLKAGS